jgi:hypothetical protein
MEQVLLLLQDVVRCREGSLTVNLDMVKPVFEMYLGSEKDSVQTRFHQPSDCAVVLRISGCEFKADKVSGFLSFDTRVGLVDYTVAVFPYVP